MTQYLESIVKFVERNDIQTALHKLNSNYNYKTALNDIADNARFLINSELNKKIKQKLPFFDLLPVSQLNDAEHKPLDVLQRQDKFWAYAIPDHGYLPQRYINSRESDNTVSDLDQNPDKSYEEFRKRFKPQAYRLGHSVDWYLGNSVLTKEALCDILQYFIDGIFKKLYSDAMSTLFAAAFYKDRIIHAGKLFDTLDIMINGIDNSEVPACKITDLYVDSDVFLNMRSDGEWTVQPNDENSCTIVRNSDILGKIPITVYRTPDMAKGGAYRQLLTLPTQNGGFGMILPSDTRHLIFGIDRDGSDVMRLYKEDIGFWADDSSYTHRNQSCGFYGWMRIACCTLDNIHVQLGTI